jgi:hypothetical protein
VRLSNRRERPGPRHAIRAGTICPLHIRRKSGLRQTDGSVKFRRVKARTSNFLRVRDGRERHELVSVMGVPAKQKAAEDGLSHSLRIAITYVKWSWAHYSRNGKPRFGPKTDTHYHQTASTHIVVAYHAEVRPALTGGGCAIDVPARVVASCYGRRVRLVKRSIATQAALSPGATRRCPCIENCLHQAANLASNQNDDNHCCYWPSTNL